MGKVTPRAVGGEAGTALAKLAHNRDLVEVMMMAYLMWYSQTFINEKMKNINI